MAGVQGNLAMRQQIDALCAAHPGATASAPDAFDSWKIGGRTFVAFGGPGPGSRLSVRTPDVATAAMLIDMDIAQRSPSFPPAWVRLRFDGLSLDEAAHRIAVSYDCVRTSLPQTLQEAF